MKRWMEIGAFMLIVCSTAFAQGPRIDVVFLLDSTGSMADEIEVVKQRIREMISEIALGEPTPDVRFGIVTYRDRGDEYVTKTFELTRDIDQIVENLGSIQAAEGGDYPESLNEALYVALHDMNWDPEHTTIKLIFLIADAPPHLDYPDDYDYKEEIQVALEKWIIVYSIGASGLDPEGVKVLTEIAEGTEGTFEWLTYEDRFVADDGDTVIVRRRGPEVTFVKGDSTWTAEEGSGFYGMGIRTGKGEMAYSAETDAAAPGSGAGMEAAGESTNNLDALITKAIKTEAEKRGVTYEEEDPSTESTIQSETWGRVKGRFIEF